MTNTQESIIVLNGMLRRGVANRTGHYDELYRNCLRRAVQHYVVASIEENEGIYKELLELDIVQLVDIVAGYDEIRAYIATHLIMEDPDTKEYELNKLQSAISKWCIAGSLFNSCSILNTWGDWYIKLGFKIQDMLSNWYYREYEHIFPWLHDLS